MVDADMTNNRVSDDKQQLDYRRVAAWSSWDWGSAAYNAVIVTFVFAVYLVEAVGEDLPGTISASSWLAWSVGAGAFVVALLAPALGQRSDARGRRKRTLAILTGLVVALTAFLFFVENDYHFLWFGLFIMAIGSIVFELAQVPYFAMIRQVSTPETLGRVSGIGWAAGYLGGIVLLLICYFGFIVGDGGLLGISTDNGFNIRLVALLAAVWFLVFSLPLFWVVPELPADANSDDQTMSLPDSYRALGRDLKIMWAHERDTLKFLVASALYRDGLTGIFVFGAVLAVQVYGIDSADVILFGIAANVVAAVGAWGAGYLDDLLGPRVVVVSCLVFLIATGTVLLFLEGPRMFWIFGLMLCLFVGPAQSASRSFLARLTKEGKEGQSFGLYATTGRAVSFLAPTLFGLFVWIGGGERWGILGIIVVLLAGLLLLLTVPAPQEVRTSSLSGESHDGAVR